jgi:hypothetical protein
MIVDDNEASPGKTGHKNPFSPLPAIISSDEIDSPVKLLPFGMQSVEVRRLFDDMLYCLTFQKPEKSSNIDVVSERVS